MKKIFLLLFLLSFGIFPIQAQWSNVPNNYGYTNFFELINNELYVSGFCNWPVVGMKASIIKWNGSNWIPVVRTDTLGAGYANTVLWYNNELYIGGGFPGIGKWNGNSWTYLGSGITGTYIKDLAVFNGIVYASGRFWNIGGLNTQGIAK